MLEEINQTQAPDSQRAARGQSGQPPVNVLFLESIYHLGGAERVTYEIIRRLNREQFRPVMCTLYEPGPVGQWFLRDGDPFHQRLINYRYDVRGLWRLGHVIKSEGIDVIYLINQPLTIFWGLAMGLLHRIPVISVVHNTFTGAETAKLRLNRFLMGKADVLLAIAEAQRKHLIDNEGFPPSLVRVIRNGIDIDRFHPATPAGEMRRKIGLEPGSTVVGIVARLVALKGLDIFLRAAKAVLQEFPETQFVVVGDGPEAGALNGLARELGVTGKVFFLGSRNDIPEIVQLFDVAVLCSRTEALPMVILEYMAMAKPVVATEVGSVRELVQDGKTGMVVPPENPEALAAAMLGLLRQPGQAAQMGAQGRSLAEKSFTMNQTVARTEQLLMELARPGKPGRSS